MTAPSWDPAPSIRPRWRRWLSAAIALAFVLTATAAAVSGLPRSSVSIVAVAPASVRTGAPSASPSYASSSVAPSVSPPGAVPAWINVTGEAGAAPPSMDSASSAYDPVDQETVLFGGCTSAACPSNDTWVFSLGQWVNVTNPSDAPPARSGASMDYDANMHGVLLFGGSAPGGALGDTWLLSGRTWTNLTWVSAAPPARRGAMMAFDPEPEENGSVLFGGLLSSGLTTNDTWVWQGWSGWVALEPSVAPPPVESAGFAYTPSDGYLLLFGGVEVCGFLCFGILNGTWELYAGEWWPTAPAATGPQGRFGGAMTYDPALGETVLFGGVNETFAYLDDTWTYAHGSWAPLASGVSPSGRVSFALSPDAGALAPVLFGGAAASADLNDTWVLEAPPAMGISFSPSTIETSIPVTVTLTVSSGSSPYQADVDFGDGSSGFVSGPGPVLTESHVYTAAGSVILSANLTDAVGATATTSSPALSVAAGPAISIKAPSSGIDAGVPVHFGVLVLSSGTPPLTFSWRFGDVSTASGANVSHAYTSPGSYTVTVNATDAAGGMATASTAVFVAPLPSLSAEASPTSAMVGDGVSLFANVTGGTAPFAYAWVFGDGNRSGSPDPVHPFPREGTYHVEVWVNDSGGGSTHATITVDIAAVNVTSAGAPLWFWASLAALIAVGAVGAALLVRSLRRGRPPT